MAQKQHRSLLNAGTFLDFAQKLSNSSKDRRASSGSPAGSQTSTSPHELPSPTASDPGPSAQLAVNSNDVTSLVSGDALEHGEEAALVLTSGEISRLSSSPASAGQLRSPETGPIAVQGQREKPDSLAGSLPSQSGSERSLTSVGNKSSGSPPVVVVVGEKENEEDRQDNSGVEGEAEVGKEGRREGGSTMAVALSPSQLSSDVNVREKEVSLKPHKNRRSSGSVSKEGSGIDSESDLDVLTNGSTPNLPSPSQSFPNALPQLEESSSHHGFETSGSSVSSPTDRSMLLFKDDKSIRSGKRKKSSSPWYSVLSSSYKTKTDEFRKYFKNIHDSEKLIADYSCALQKDILVQGRMYVTENWLCFYANIFKWETLLTIKLKAITAITKERTIRLIPNAIQVAADNEKYFFTSFMSRDRTFLLLFKVWQNALLDQKMPSDEYWTRVHSNYGNNLGLGADDLPEDYVLPHHMSDGTENEGNDLDEESKSQGTEGNDEEDEELEDGDEEDEEEEEDGEHDSEDPSELEGDKGPDVKGQEEVVKQEVKVESSLEAAKALDEEGEVASLETKSLDAKEYMNSYFKVTVDDFVAALYSQEHPFYRNFLIHRKHTDIVIGAWQKEDEDTDVRKVSYFLHLNSFKTVGVEERQILHKNWSRPGHSSVVTIEVCQKGILYADYFYTEARMVITRVSSTSCHVRVNAHLIYKKSAWGIIKGFIEKSADSGVKEKHVELDAYVKKHLSNAETRTPVATVTKKTKKSRKRKIGAKMEEREEQLRPLSRMPSVSNVTQNTNSLSRYLNSLERMDSKSVMLLICIFLTFLSIVNVSLFLQLQSLEQLAVSPSPDFASTQFSEKLKDFPKSKEQWTSLLEKQLYYHELEMERWREILGLCIDLMKKMEITLQEIHNGIKPVRVRDMDAELNGADVQKPEQT
ncbi:protein Aster-B-like isoform X3 [Asterias rubens]|uniref:protein Aster-B-like isoform X3 n=1 Tax=Asterias rubens TaxID=7604 RepID=UPI0014554B19|nr:protein Aster-B-like isoform X3 [Asterias rubens]